jgi:hypothetical protein
MEPIAALKNRHCGSSIAVLGSGPSLARYTGDCDAAIAVNGAAASDRDYQYFVCGDRRSPERAWFLSSQARGATRIVASFVAPYDPVLYPDADVRRRLQADLAVHRQRWSRFGKGFVFGYRPAEVPVGAHAWFRYGRSVSPRSVRRLGRVPPGDSPRFLRGASIAGIALQLAAYMGAGEVRLFGVDFDNFDGHTYLDPSLNTGVTKAHHPGNFALLVDQVERLGTPVRTGADP